MSKQELEIMPIINPAESNWPELLARPLNDRTRHFKKVAQILEKVRVGGDKTLRKLTKKYDGVKVRTLQVSEQEISAAGTALSPQLREAILQAKNNIETFHRSQLIQEQVVETMPGVRCWRRSVGIDRVGLYIPGGSAPLFSTVLMLGIPASLAGCAEVILCTPPGADGEIHPAILFAAREAGIRSIYKVGGAQAIAAMTYGTESIKPVYKIFGPGNQFVDAAKQLIQLEGVAIDMPAGPSEVCVIADDTADAAFIAADLLSQAEHGPDSQVVLITTSVSLAHEVIATIKLQLKDLPRQATAAAALKHCRIIVVRDIATATRLANDYAAEHLIICCQDCESIAMSITNAGSVFLGNFSPESAGDYASGTNHTLPTNGMARAFSGVSVDSFVRKITYQQLTPGGLADLAPVITTMAAAEGLQAHAAAVNVRLQKIKQ